MRFRLLVLCLPVGGDFSPVLLPSHKLREMCRTQGLLQDPSLLKPSGHKGYPSSGRGIGESLNPREGAGASLVPLLVLCGFLKSTCYGFALEQLSPRGSVLRGHWKVHFVHRLIDCNSLRKKKRKGAKTDPERTETQGQEEDR